MYKKIEKYKDQKYCGRDPVLVCLDCHNKISLRRWLNKKDNIFSKSSGDWEAKNLGVSQFDLIPGKDGSPDLQLS